MSTPHTCPVCNGTGKNSCGSECPACKGTCIVWDHNHICPYPVPYIPRYPYYDEWPYPYTITYYT